MKTLITGGDGFIGKRLVSSLSRKNNEIHVVDLKPIRSKHDKKYIFFHKINICSSSFKNLVKEIQPNIIYHLAALHHIPTCNNNPQSAYKNNILGTQNLIDSLESLKNLKKIIFTSSGAVYDWSNIPLKENNPLNPKDVYSLSKFVNEKQFELSATKDLDIVIARLFNVIGPNDPNGHLIPDIKKQISKKNKKIVLGNLKPKRDYIYIEDVVYFLKNLSLKKSKNKIDYLNISSGIEYDVRQIAKIVLSVNNSAQSIVSDFSRVRKNDRPSQHANINKLLRLFPKYKFSKIEDVIHEI